MATRETYKQGIDIVSPEPSGTGGDLIQDNFKTIADALETQSAAIAGKAAASHTHSTSDVTGLETALANKAASNHTHPISEISNLTAELDSKAEEVHTHATSDVSGLDTALSGKAAASHSHTTSDISDFPTLATVATSGSYNDLTNKPTIPAAYSLPTASTSTLGGVKVDGSTITINNNGVISASGGGGGGSSTLADLTDVSLSSPYSGQVLKYDGSNWVNGTVSGGSGGTQVYGSPQALITKANIGSPSVNDDDRGYLSVDFQAERADSTNFAKGDYSFLHGRNSGISAQDGYAFGTGTDFDVAGAIQTNQNKAGVHGWQGHTGVLGLCFAPGGSLNAEIFALDTGAIALFDVDIIAVSDGRLTLYKLALSVYQGSLTVDYNQFTPICQWTPNFYLSNNKLYLTGGYADVVQVGIRYTILGASTSDDGASSSGGEE